MRFVIRRRLFVVKLFILGELFQTKTGCAILASPSGAHIKVKGAEMNLTAAASVAEARNLRKFIFLGVNDDGR